MRDYPTLHLGTN